MTEKRQTQTQQIAFGYHLAGGRILGFLKKQAHNAERCPLFCDEKTSEAVQGEQGEAAAGFFRILRILCKKSAFFCHCERSEAIHKKADSSVDCHADKVGSQ